MPFMCLLRRSIDYYCDVLFYLFNYILYYCMFCCDKTEGFMEVYFVYASRVRVHNVKETRSIEVTSIFSYKPKTEE